MASTMNDHPDYQGLFDWVKENIEVVDILEKDARTIMLSTGHDENLVNEVIQDCFHPRPQQLTPWPDLSNGQIWVGDRTVRAIAVSEREPKWVLFENLLSTAEIDELIELAKPKLAPSTGVHPISGKEHLSSARTSQGAYFKVGEGPLITRLESRIAALVNWPVSKGEGLQVLRYAIGEEYIPHHDFFDPAFIGNTNFIGKPGNRVGTMLIYLETPEEGGETSMVDIGMKVFPQKGNVFFFAYDRPSVTTMTQHAGMPVIKGAKMIATKWFRERSY